MTYTEIKFCQIDKPESHSFQLDFWNEIDGIITYSNIQKYTSNRTEFYNIENIFKQINRFDLILERTTNPSLIGANSTSIIKNRFILPEIIEINNVESFTSQKVNSLTIKPIMIWDLENYDVEFFKHLPAIRREIQLLKLGI